MARKLIDVVQQALEHLPPEELTPAQLHQIDAWIDSKRGDTQAEHRELERLLVADASDLTAIDRLAQMADQDGQHALAAELRRKRDEMAGLRARYQKLHERNQPIRDALEMAHLAERLGRRFEARVFLTLAIFEDPDRADLKHDLQRLSRDPRSGKVAGLARRRAAVTRSASGAWRSANRPSSADYGNVNA
jgi:hypothetical protein